MTYCVAMPFDRNDDGELVAGEARERQSAGAAKSAARRMAALATASTAPTPAARGPVQRTTWVDDWRSMAASLVVAAALSSGLTYSLVAPDASQSVEDEIVGGHRRSLLASSAIDVASSDRHTVRPWFSSKGFPLVGGRVEVVSGQPVPTLVYRRGPHMITVVAKPAASGLTAPPIVGTDEGYNIVRWTNRGFSYCGPSRTSTPRSLAPLWMHCVRGLDLHPGDKCVAGRTLAVMQVWWFDGRA